MCLTFTQALHHIHKQDLVHLDIKPDNIYVVTNQSGDGEESIIYKLGDLGLIYNLSNDNELLEVINNLT